MYGVPWDSIDRVVLIVINISYLTIGPKGLLFTPTGIQGMTAVDGRRLSCL